jgi:hypothetical protein
MAAQGCCPVESFVSGWSGTPLGPRLPQIHISLFRRASLLSLFSCFVVACFLNLSVVGDAEIVRVALAAGAADAKAERAGGPLRQAAQAVREADRKMFAFTRNDSRKPVYTRSYVATSLFLDPVVKCFHWVFPWLPTLGWIHRHRC